MPQGLLGAQQILNTDRANKTLAPGGETPADPGSAHFTNTFSI